MISLESSLAKVAADGAIKYHSNPRTQHRVHLPEHLFIGQNRYCPMVNFEERVSWQTKCTTNVFVNYGAFREVNVTLFYGLKHQGKSSKYASKSPITSPDERPGRRGECG